MGRITSTVAFQVQQQKRRGSKCYFSARGNPGLATAPAEKTIAPNAPWDLATFLSYLLLKSATLIPWNEDILKTWWRLQCQHPPERSRALVLFQVTLRNSPRVHVQDFLPRPSSLPPHHQEHILFLPGNSTYRKPTFISQTVRLPKYPSLIKSPLGEQH